MHRLHCIAVQMADNNSVKVDVTYTGKPNAKSLNLTADRHNSDVMDCNAVSKGQKRVLEQPVSDVTSQVSKIPFNLSSMIVADARVIEVSK